MADENGIDVRVGAETQGVEEGMQRAASVVQEAVSRMSGSMEGMAAIAGAVAGTMQELVRTLVEKVGEAIKQAVSAFSNLAGEIERLNNITGVGLRGASILADSLGDLGIRTETYEGVIQRLTMRLRTSSDRFEELGVKVKDAGTGAFLPTDEILRNTLSTLMQYKEGTDRNLAATEMLGRGWKELFPLLRMTPELMEENARQAEQFGMIITEKDVTAMWSLKLAVADATKPLEGMWVTIGRALNPMLQELARVLQEVLTVAFYVVTGSVRGFLTFLEYLQNGLYTVSEVVIMVGNIFTKTFAAIGTAMGKALRGDFSGAADALKTGMFDVEKVAKQSLDNIAEHSRRTNERVANMWGVDGAGDAAKTGEKGYTPKDKDKSGKDRGLFDEWRKELQQMRDDADVFRGLELKEEAAFWEEKIALTRKGSEDRRKAEHELSQVKKKMAQEELRDALQALNSQKELASKNKEEQVKIAEARLQLMKAIYGEDSRQYREAEKEKTKALREQAEERKRIDLEMLKHTQELRAIDLQGERETVDFMRQMGLITNEEKLKALAELNEREYRMRRDTLEQKAALEQEDVLRHQQTLNELEKLDAEYQLKVQKNLQQQALEAKTIWDEILGAVSNAVSTSVKGIIMGTTTLEKALKNLFQSIVLSFADMAMKMFMEWMKKQIMMTLFQKTEAAVRTATEVTSAIAGMAAQKAAASAEISASAAAAGAAGVKSAAAIPYVGWAMAPAAGAMDYAAAIAYQGMVGGVGGGLMSAEGGVWDIPRDQMAMVHKKEMILPAEHAENLRSMASEGGGGGGNNFYINAVDASSIKRLLRREGGALVDSLKAQARNFRSTK